MALVTSIANAAVIEGQSGTRTLVFTVYRDDASTVSTVDFATGDGTAIGRSDYIPLTGTVRFDLGEETATISIVVVGDPFFESDETFYVGLSNPSQGSLGSFLAVGSILNDDLSDIPAPAPGAYGGTTAGVALTAAPGSLTPTVTANFQNVVRYQPSSSAPLPATVTTPAGQVLPNPMLEQQTDLQALIALIDAGVMTLAQAQDRIVDLADATTSVALMSYQFFTGRLPSQAGVDYLVSSPQNPADLNDGYYAGMSLENRYINFAVNLGKLGEGRAAFTAGYGALSLGDAAAKAYFEIFGAPADAAKVAAILTPQRSGYFLSLGGDALGQKAAMVGFLLAEAAKTDTGPYSARNENFLYDLLDGSAAFAADAHVYDYAGPIRVGLVGLSDA